MARATGVTNWRCDRCGKKSEQPGDKTPRGWAKHERQPMGEPESARDEWDICDGCDSLVQRLLQPINAPDNGTSRKMVGSGPPLSERELIAGYGGAVEWHEL